MMSVIVAIFQSEVKVSLLLFSELTVHVCAGFAFFSLHGSLLPEGDVRFAGFSPFA